MIPLFYSYDGWEFLSWVGGEIKDPRRNLPLALIFGIVLIIVTYLLANAVFLYALTPAQLAQTTTPAAAAMGLFSHRTWDAGCRCSSQRYRLAPRPWSCSGEPGFITPWRKDGAFFRAMTRLHPRWNTPVTSLLAQCAWVCVLIFSSRYDQLYTCFIFMMTLTYAMTVGAVLVLRRTQPERPRPYRCFGYPWLPIIYLVIASGFVLSTFPRPSRANRSTVWHSLCSASRSTGIGARGG